MRKLETHFTSTTYIVDQGKLLLLHHHKFNKWMPPGGHLEEGEAPSECACREAYEETGFEVDLIKDEHLWIKCPTGGSIERPFMCLVFDVPAHKNEPPHHHIDFSFLAKPKNGISTALPEVRWFSENEIAELHSKGETFPEVFSIAEKIFFLLKKGWPPIS